MAGRNPSYAPDAAADTIDYKPLSILALFGLTLAAAYTALLLIGAVAAFRKGEPYFEPFFLGAWGIALPIGGAVLSGLGLWQISTSEGTQAGTLLAKWGLGLSLVTGLGYFTYQSFTQLAILQQANRFFLEKDEASGFFPRLQGTEVDARTAYLFTLGVVDRSVRPENAEDVKRLDLPTAQNPRGLLTQFLESPLVRAIRVAAPGTVKIEPLAVRSWSYENRAYLITRIYRISTDEAVYEVPLTVSSIEPIAEGEKRTWKVDWQAQFLAPLQPLSRTDLGNKRQGLRQQAREFLNDPQTGWFTRLKHRDALEVYLGTQPAAARKALLERMAAIHVRTPLIALAGASVPPIRTQTEEQLRSRLLPDYWPLNKAVDYFKVDSMRHWDPTFLAKAKAAGKKALAPDRLSLLAPRVVPDDQARCEVHQGEVLVTYQVELVPDPIGQKAWPDLLLLLKVVVAAPESLDPAAAGADQQWRVRSVEFDRALPIPPPQM